MRESQLLTHYLSRGTGGTKPSLVHVVEALRTRVLLPGHQVSPKSTTWLATKAHHKGTCQAPLVALMLPPLRTFSTKGGGLHVPRTKCHRLSKPERQRLLPESHLGSKASSTLCTTWSTRKSSHKVLCILWQPARENTVLSPKTDPLWSLSNSKVSSCVGCRVNARWITWTSNRGSIHALKLTRRRVQSTTWIKHFITKHCSWHGVKVQSSKIQRNNLTSGTVNITGGRPWCHHLSSPFWSTTPAINNFKARLSILILSKT
jgi:hypothetical protein